jgi:hypothetical protein
MVALAVGGIILLICPSEIRAQQTCFAVTPSGAGSKNGSSWSNAYAGLPSSLVRGAIYYLGDGNYGNHLNLTTAASGSLTIELRKAQSYDFGSGGNCTSSIGAGWSTSTMGSGQAYWASTGSGQIVNISGGYWIINGNGNGAATEIGCGGVNANPPTTMKGPAPSPSACGIKIDDSTCTSTATDGCDGGSGVMNGSGANTVWESVEWFGQGLNANGNNNSETYFWFATSPLTNVTITHSYLHNASTTYLTVVNGSWNNGSFDHNYVWGVYDGSTNHGEAIQLQGSNSGDAVHHNIFRDQQTNGDMVAVISGTQSNMAFYDNVDFCSAGGNSTTCRHNDGVIGCFNSQTCSNYVIYNNTFSFPGNCGWNVTGGPSTMTVKNNLWYNCGSVGMTGGTNTIDYNSYLNSGQSAVGSHDVSSSSAPNPLVNSAAGNLSLASENALWDNRVSLGAPYDTDIAGHTFTTDRGAYQFQSSTCGITPSSIGPYTAGQNVSQTFTESSCTAGQNFTISAGTLTGSGLALSSSGMLNGTAEAGTFLFTVAYGTGVDAISLVVNPSPSIASSSLAAGQVNVSYSQTLTTSGGTGAVSCAVTSGSLPTGTALSGCTISGIPTNASTYNFSVTPTDANGVSGSAHAFSILVNVANTSTPVVLHTTFCGPGSSWPATCTLSAPTTAGSRLVVAYSSYNSAGSTPVMNSITDGAGDMFSALPNARSTNTSSASSWNDIWSAANVAGGQTVLTITPSTAQVGDVYVWEVQYASSVVGCASLSSQPAANPAIGAALTTGSNVLLLSQFHPAPGGNPTGVSSPFTSSAISDQMAYASDAVLSAGTYGPQWTQTAATFATATCAFSAVLVQPPTSLTPTAH